jgi:glycosyltransferase involved in cell wall biosynthesis
MRIVYISYVSITDYHDPESWLKRLDFYEKQLMSLSAYAEVVSIHHIQYEGSLERDNVKYVFFKRKKWQLLFPFRLHRYIKTLAPDVVIVHGLVFPVQVVFLRCQLGSVKLFVVHHAEKPLRFPKDLIQRLSDRFIHGYFFSSSALGDLWIKRNQISSPEKVHEVMEVSSIFHSTRDLTEVTLIRDTYLWVGRFDSNKDPLTLLRAFLIFLRERPNIKLHIVFRGGNLVHEVYQILSAEKILSARIVLTENIDHDALLSVYNNAAFIISTSHYEGSGMAVCEGMSCGCIPILTNIPSFRMMTLQGKIGLLFEPGDVNSLYNALCKSTELDLMSERKKVLEQFQQNLSHDAISEKMIKIISAP